MKLHFSLCYSSRFGEEAFLRFQNKNAASPVELAMNFKDAAKWEIHIDDETFSQSVSYYDIIIKEKNNERLLCQGRMLDIRKQKKEIIHIIDEPQTNPPYSKVFQSPFFEVINAFTEKKKFADKNASLMIQMQMPLLNPHLTPCITGSAKKLNHWNENKPLLFYKKNDGWAIKINLRKEDYPIEYKIGLFDAQEEKLTVYEKGPNRILLEAPAENEINILHPSPELDFSLFKATGLNIPLFSIRTNHTWGVGDFSALITMGDWCKKCGIKLIQLLPLYDTHVQFSEKDAYPYAPISAFALHPIYLDVIKIAKQYNTELPINSNHAIQKLNAADTINYPDALRLKLHWLKFIYEKAKHVYRNDFAWFDFFNLNREWLLPYAVFCVLRDKNNTPDFTKWKQHQKYNESLIEEFTAPDNPDYDEIGFWYFLQYQLHLQLHEAKQELNTKGIALKGDLPIGIARFSTETWMHPQYFYLQYNAGAPPDAFSDKGQNWFFPTYNWQQQEADNFIWWRKRLQYLQQYFDALRIDHILGLFRMWSIPEEINNSQLGYFQPIIPFTEEDLLSRNLPPLERLLSPLHNESDVILIKENDRFHFRINMQLTDSFRSLSMEDQQIVFSVYQDYLYNRSNALWHREGEKKIKMLQSFTSMLICAEDLGMVPPMVEKVLNDNEVLCLRIERMPVNNEMFFNISNAPYLSVVMPSTHDMNPIRLWWKEKNAPVQQYYNYNLSQTGIAPLEADADICYQIIKRHLQSPAQWCIFQFQDILACDIALRNANPDKERINNPDNAEHIWNYRMHLPLESLLDAKIFNHFIKDIIRSTGR